MSELGPGTLDTLRRLSARRGGSFTKPVKGDQTETAALHSPPTERRRLVIEAHDDVTADAILNMVAQMKNASVVETGNAESA